MTFFWRFLEKNHHEPLQTTTKPPWLNHHEPPQTTTIEPPRTTMNHHNWTTTNHYDWTMTWTMTFEPRHWIMIWTTTVEPRQTTTKLRLMPGVVKSLNASIGQGITPGDTYISPRTAIFALFSKPITRQAGFAWLPASKKVRKSPFSD